jgi:hypothetical protein
VCNTLVAGFLKWNATVLPLKKSRAGTEACLPRCNGMDEPAAEDDEGTKKRGQPFGLSCPSSAHIPTGI